MLDLAADVLKRVPEEIDYEQTAKIMADDPCPLNVVLLQEVKQNKVWLYIKQSVYVMRLLENILLKSHVCNYNSKLLLRNISLSFHSSLKGIT